MEKKDSYRLCLRRGRSRHGQGSFVLVASMMRKKESLGLTWGPSSSITRSSYCCEATPRDSSPLAYSQYHDLDRGRQCFCVADERPGRVYKVVPEACAWPPSVAGCPSVWVSRIGVPAVPRLSQRSQERGGRT